MAKERDPPAAGSDIHGRERHYRREWTHSPPGTTLAAGSETHSPPRGGPGPTQSVNLGC